MLDLSIEEFTIATHLLNQLSLAFVRLLLSFFDGSIAETCRSCLHELTAGDLSWLNSAANTRPLFIEAVLQHTHDDYQQINNK